MRRLMLTSVSHRDAGLELRERLALRGAKLERLRAEARGAGLEEWVFLSTCNRVELYFVAGDAAAGGRLVEILCGIAGVERAAFEAAARRLAGRDAAEHLAAVAAGLESQLAGETEIFGQVKEAYADAARRGETGPLLNRVFQKSFQWAKWARTHTAVGAGHVSVAGVATHLAARIFGDLRNVRALLLGAGDIAEKTARALLDRGAGGVAVANRTEARARALAAELGARAVALPWDGAMARLGEFSVVMGATAAEGAVVSLRDVEAAMARRRAEPLFLMDLALPRDFDPEAARVENVFLYNLDDLARIAARNRAAREGELARARKGIGERAARWWASAGGA